MNKKRIALTLFMALLSEVANKLVPLVTLHFVATRLGTAAFGTAQFALWLIDWGIFFTVYGFAQVAPIMLRNASTPKDLKLVHGSVSLARFLLSCAATIVLLVLVNQYQDFLHYKAAVVSSLFILFTSAIDSAWVLLARQKMALWSILSIVAKLTSLVATLIFIESPDHGVRFVVITNLANGFMSLASFAIALKIIGISCPDSRDVLSALKIASPFAVSSLLMTSMERFDLYLVEQNFDASAVGIYSAASKLVASLTPIIFTITTVFYSEMMAHSDLSAIHRHVKASVFWTISAVAPMIIGIWFVDRELIRFVFGPDYMTGEHILSILVSGSGFYAIITIFGLQLLTLKGEWRPLVKGLIIGTMVGVIFGVSAIDKFGLSGVALGGFLARLTAASIIIWIAFKMWSLNILQFATTFIRALAPALAMGLSLFSARYMGFLTGQLIPTVLFGAAIYATVFSLLNLSELKIILNKVRASFLNRSSIV